MSSTDSSILSAVSDEKIPTINGNIVFAERTIIARIPATILVNN
jgi:hypothetical protein